jgi:hypothetical protein
MKPTIEILIQPTGELQIEGIGFKGSSCEAATKALEAALGVTKTKQRKPEYHQRQTTKPELRLNR